MRTSKLMVIVIFLVFQTGPVTAAEASHKNSEDRSLEIQSVTVDGQRLTWRAGRDLNLGPSPQEIVFNFGPAAGSPWRPLRLRYKLEGHDDAWQEGRAMMGLTIRFSDERGDQISQTTFEARGESAGWNGALTNSMLSHRRETLVVPPQASRLWISISSGFGPPETVGLYVIDDLGLSRHSISQGLPEVLLHPLLDRGSVDSAPPDWVRDGIRPSMARMVGLGGESDVRALAILDDDPAGHAEWHNLRQTAPRVTPGERLVLEWNELFSVGVGDTRAATYSKLRSGDYRFRVQEVTPVGAPTGVEATFGVRVPLPIREMPFFWPTVTAAVVGLSLVTGRYVAWRRMSREVVRLKQQRALEQDRLRIAQDIHDDLGARVTQIALLSGMAQNYPGLPENARTAFDDITRMTRELVSALYETVWSVNPENDNLDALGNYLCQLVNKHCSQARIRCRLSVVDLPATVQVSSQCRHTIIMVVKEAVHNVIKHANAAEVKVHAGFNQGVLTISVEDDGHGFHPAGVQGGSGLTNMKRRLEEIGGTCDLRSEPGRGTSVELRLSIKPSS